MKQVLDFIGRQTGSHDWVVLVFVVVFAMMLLNYFMPVVSG